jgi:hypothetical protein
LEPPNGDTLLLPVDGLPHANLVEQIPEGGIWRPQSSGWVLRPDVAVDLETLWAQHLGQAVPLPPRSSPRQGWQMDPARRKKVEDAAQDRLMAHYGERGAPVSSSNANSIRSRRCSQASRMACTSLMVSTCGRAVGAATR